MTNKWIPKRGDRIRVWDNPSDTHERIFLEMKGVCYMCVPSFQENLFNEGKVVGRVDFMNASPLSFTPHIHETLQFDDAFECRVTNNGKSVEVWKVKGD